MLRWIDEAIVHARVQLFSKYMSSEQAAQLLGRQLEHKQAWPELVRQVREQMLAGIPSDAPLVRQLAARWQQLFLDSYCGDDEELMASVRRALDKEPRLSLGVGVDEALMHYVRAAAH